MDDKTLSWCMRLIGCASVTGEGTREIAELCARELLAPCGITAALIPSRVEGDSQVSLFARIEGREPQLTPIVLNTHLDTVPPGDRSAWTECAGNPFSATIKEGRIYGLGAADTKLDFVAKTAALTEIVRPRRTVWLVGTFGEEHGLAGAKELAAGNELPRGALAYIGEPSRLQVITAHKGLLVFDLRIAFEPEKLDEPEPLARLTFKGRAAHSSTPDLGVNAIDLAIRFMTGTTAPRISSISGGDAINKVPARCEVLVSAASIAGEQTAPFHEDTDAACRSFIPPRAIATLHRFIEGLRRFAQSGGAPEPDYAPPTLTCNPGLVRSDDISITLGFELRPPPSMSLQQVRDGLAGLVGQFDGGGVGIELKERRANPGFRSALDGQTVELAMSALAAANLPLATGVKAGCTEAGIYAAAGLHPIVFGPGPSTGVIHAPNEYNFVEDVEGAVRFYSNLLRL